MVNQGYIELPIALDADYVAYLLSVSDDTVKNLHRTGQLPGHLIGKHLRWFRSDVDEYVIALRTKNNRPKLAG